MRSSAFSVLVYDAEKGKDYMVLPNRGKVKFLVGATSLIALYFALQSDIKEAKELPVTDV